MNKPALWEASPPHGGVDRNETVVRPGEQAGIVAPTRGRGSKPRSELPLCRRHCRPHTGAWIETPDRGQQDRAEPGRPHTGAWIETVYPYISRAYRTTVAPTRGRGSKPQPSSREDTSWMSPPHGGVDRNMDAADVNRLLRTSPPHGGVDRNRHDPAICPERIRRPHTGAWIETSNHTSPGQPCAVAPTRGRGSKHDQNAVTQGARIVAPTRGRGSKHLEHALGPPTQWSPPHGGVDRNSMNAI